MRAELSTIQQMLTPEAASVLARSIVEAVQRKHGRITPLHVAAVLLAAPSGVLRRSCLSSHPDSAAHPLCCRALELCFSIALDRLPSDGDLKESVLEALRPNVHLRRLEIISYKGVEIPTWMSKQQLARFDSLSEVKLINLRRCAMLSSLGQLSHLEELEISGMDLIKQIDDTFYGDGDIFPKLERFTFSEMLALEKWYVPKRKNVELCPRLEKLTLIQCPKLKEIDVLIDSDFTMRVWLNSKMIWSVEFYNWYNLQYIREIEIVGYQELKCLPQGMQSLKRLTGMSIISCINLMTLITLDSLEVLHIYACPMLEFNLEVFTKLSN